ncbi:MAG: YfgM family protein, partial [Lysobacter sp.]
LASLELAKSQLTAGQRDAAIATLRAARPAEPALAQVVNERLARLLIDAKQADAALKLMDAASTPSALEVRGDAQFALGQRERARETYQQALAKLDVASPNRRVLELKLTEVGGTPAKSEAKS